MKAELLCRPHGVVAGASVFEVWYGGKFIATVAGAEGPGIKLISKHPVIEVRRDDEPPMITEVLLDPTQARD